MMNRSIVIFVVAAFFAMALASQAQAGLISERQELQMGHDAAKQIEAKYPVSTDKRATAMVEEMGRRIAAVSGRPNIPWRFKVLEVKDVNALAVPGYVYINRGLIDFAGNDRDALAGVVAHEVAHTAARHSVRLAEKQLKYQLAMQFLFKDNNAKQLGNFATNLAMLGYGRREEFDADRLGVQYMKAAGYDPKGMLRFFRKLEQNQGRDPGGLSVYFRTHPPTSERISRIEQQIASSEGRVAAAPAPRQPSAEVRGIRSDDILWAILARAAR